jgi:hypothetical protein
MRKLKKINEGNSELRLANVLKVVIDWIDAWILAVVAGRGMSKSTEIQAQRIMTIVQDMPGAPFAFICDTYVNFRSNIFDAIKTGWKRKKWREGIHFVCFQRPPQEWLDKCSIIVSEFDHAIFFWNGCVLFVGSLDRPSLLAGKSVVHLFSDEAKFQPDKKVDLAFPILRGDATMFGYSVYFLGMTVTTDMPNVSEGEYDWIFRFAKDMDPKRIELILHAFGILNDLRLKLYNEQNGKNREKEVEKLEKEIAKAEYDWKKARWEQTYFVNASSLVNIQFLTVKYLKGLIKKFGIEELKKAVLGIRPALKRTLRFYTNLSDKHFYNDGYDYAYYDKFGFNEKVKDDSRGLRYIDKSAKLEGGMDFGNMKSLVIAQEDGRTYRLLKFLYTIPPHSFRELADQFIAFFLYHDNKVIDLYYDRAGNNLESMKEDDARKIKDMIEKDGAGNRTGWMVNLMSRGQGTIEQDAEYEFMLQVLAEETPGLPHIRIDALNCKQVKSSLEKAPAKVKYGKGGRKIISKEKKSEKLPPERLPMESTNPSDAVKYLLCRTKWMQLTRKKKSSAFIGVGMN